MTSPSSRPLATVTLTVHRIVKTPTQKPGLDEFLIEGESTGGQTMQLQTVNAWRASLCEQARRMGQPITVAYERTRYGKTIRKATLSAPTDWSAA